MLNTIISKLNTKINKPVILGNQNRPKPNYPFVAYNITSPYIQGLGRESRSIEIVDGDTEETRIDQAQIVVSFTAYSDDSTEAYDLCLGVRDYFSNQAEFELRREGIVVVEIEDMQNTDTLIVDDYERRFTIDVRFRFVHTSKKIYETIEEVNI